MYFVEGLMKRFRLAIVLTLMVVGHAVAETKVTPDEDLPKSGNLSSTFLTGHAVSTVPEPFGFDELNRDAQSPITGSVSRAKKPGFWELKVFNNSKETTYSVDVEVRQLDVALTVVKRDYFTYTLAPDSSKNQMIIDRGNTKGAELELTKFTNLTVKKKVAVKPTPATPSTK